MTSSDEAPELNAPMLSLFRKDVHNQTILLQEHLLALQAKTDLKNNICGLVAASHSIGCVALIVHYKSLAELAKTLESFFLYYQQSSPYPEIEDYSPLFTVVENLKAVAELDDAALKEKIRQPTDQILSSLARGISRLVSTSSKNERSEEAVGIPSNIPSPGLSKRTDNAAMMELFKIELENQVKTLINGIVSIDQGENVNEQYEAILRSAHSIKGAAQIVQLNPIIQLAHVLEECLVAAKNEHSIFTQELIAKILNSVDILARISHMSQSLIKDWIEREKNTILTLKKELSSLLTETVHSALADEESKPSIKEERKETFVIKPLRERILRVSAQNLSRLMDLAGESLIESRRLYPINDSMIRLKKNLNELTSLIETFKDRFEEKMISDVQATYWDVLHQKAQECRQLLDRNLPELSSYIARYSTLTDQLYRNVIDSRMRPFGDAVESFPRMVRDLAQQLNKKARLSIIGTSTPVDRDILEKLETPLAHLLRNAIDHGIELPEIRIALGKPPEGLIRIEARHQAGMLMVSVFDDGGGIDIEDIKKKIVKKGLMNQEMVSRLSDSELIDFLFLSGFSTTEQVTEISGRGVGLNAVQNMIHEVAGSIRTEFIPGKGMSFNMLLPLTLSVVRTLVVEIAGEPYAFLLTRIDRLFQIPRENLETFENIQYFNNEGQNIGLVWASGILELDQEKTCSLLVPVILLKERKSLCGIVVDRFIGEKELVVRELDPRLGTIANISSGAIMEDGSPILIIDAENLVRAIDNLPSSGLFTTQKKLN